MATPSKLESTLNELVAPYRADLARRRLENPEVRQTKEEVLDFLVSFDTSPNAPSELEQIELKLALINRMRFGSSTHTYKYVNEHLTSLKNELDAPSPATLKFSRSSAFVKGFIDGLLKLLGLQPNIHFDDVMTAAKAALIKAASGYLIYGSAEEVAQGTQLTSEKIAAARSTTEEAMQDFARTTTLNGKLYRKEDDVTDNDYQEEMQRRVLQFTGETDATRGYADEILHVAGQTNAAAFTEALYAQIPSLRDDFKASFKPASLTWGEDGGGIYLDTRFNVVSAQSLNDSEQFYIANRDSEATEPEIIDDLTASQLRSGELSVKPLVECFARIRYALDPNVARPIPTVANFEVINHYPEVFQFSPQAKAHITASLNPPPPIKSPRWIREAGDHLEKPDTLEHRSASIGSYDEMDEDESEDEGDDTPSRHP
ncbi:MAG TPA: hypothetical protein VD770_04635 [Coxiellaceae bacterium]|nr:hypothetical protein [Coxiellaceae bacterium]